MSSTTIEDALLVQSDALLDRAAAQEAFNALAEMLLNAAVIEVGESWFRPAEIEFYFQDDEQHHDPFAHADPIQAEPGRWYFHRSGGSYKSGSYKGLDISFGAGDVFGGVLLRGLLRQGEQHIDGPSLCVDALLEAAQADDVASFDATIDARKIWDPSNPMVLRLREDLEQSTLYATGRVGLTLKARDRRPARVEYLLRRYRFLSQPRGSKKGRVHLLIALLEAGMSVEASRALTGSPRRTIEGFRDAYEEGREQGEMLDYKGKALKSKDLATLYGIDAAAHEDA